VVFGHVDSDALCGHPGANRVLDDIARRQRWIQPRGECRSEIGVSRASCAREEQNLVHTHGSEPVVVAGRISSTTHVVREVEISRLRARGQVAVGRSALRAGAHRRDASRAGDECPPLRCFQCRLPHRLFSRLIAVESTGLRTAEFCAVERSFAARQSIGTRVGVSIGSRCPETSWVRPCGRPRLSKPSAHWIAQGSQRCYCLTDG